MTIFTYTMKRLFRNKIQLFFILLFPLAFMSLGFIGAQPSIKVAVIDHDDTSLTNALKLDLKEKVMMKTIDESNIEKALMDLQVDYVLKLEQGFTDSLVSGNAQGVTVYSVKESNLSKPVHTFVEQWINQASMIATAVNYDQQTFSTFKTYHTDGALQLDHQLLIDPGAARTKTVIGYLVIAMLYTSLIVGLFIIMNKNNFTMFRTLAAPITIRYYMIQMIVSFLCVSFIQLVFVLSALKWIYKLYFGEAIYSIFFLLLLFSLVSVAFGVAISSLSRSIIQACLIGICVIAPMAMLGGAYFPLDYAPDVIQTISSFTPIYWLLGSIEKLLHGQSLFSQAKEMFILMLFALIFIMLGTIRKTDIMK